MNKFLFLAVVSVASAAGAAGDEGLVEEKTRNPWHFRIGPVMAPRVRVKVSGPHFALPVMPRVGSQTGGNGAAAPAGGAAGYEYADGYVRPDAGTQDPGAMTQGNTWDWGARDMSSQYNGESVEFHTGMTHWDETVTAVSTFGGASTESDRDVLLGVDAMGGWTFYDDGAFDIAIDAGFRFYGTGSHDAESRYGTSVTTRRDEYQVVDSYRPAHAWQPEWVPPDAYNGQEGGLLLHATPDSRDDNRLMSSASSTERRYYSGSAKFNYNIWDLRLGPTLGWKATDWFALRGGVYGLLGLVKSELKTTANADGGRRSSSESTCDAIFGMAFALSAQINLTENFFIYGGTEYDWWTNSVRVRNDGASAQIKLSDFTVSAGIGVEF